MITKFFLRIYTLFLRHRSWSVFCLIGLCLLLSWGASRIRFEEDISRFMPMDKKISHVLQNMKSGEQSFILLSAHDTAKTDMYRLMDAADEMYRALNEGIDSKLLKSVVHRIDESLITEVPVRASAQIAYLADPKDYAHFDSICTPDQINLRLLKHKELLSLPTAWFLQGVLQNDPLLFSQPILHRFQNLQAENKFIIQDGYLFTPDGKQLLLRVKGVHPVSETRENKKFVEQIEALLESFSQENQDCRISYFGPPAVAVSNASRIKKDSLLSVILALVFIGLILGSYFRNTRSLLFLMLPVLFGGLVGICALALFRENVSLVAIGAGSVVIGIAINYSLHFLVHRKHTASSRKTLQDIASPMIIGSITTMGAFLSLCFIRSEAMIDFGIFSAASLGGTLLFVLVFLPLLWRKEDPKKEEISSSNFIDKIANYSIKNKRLVFCFIVGMTLFFAYFSSHTRFETDMMKLNYMTEEQNHSYEIFKDISAVGEVVWYHLAYGSTLDQALENYEQALPIMERMLDEKRLQRISGINGCLLSQKEANRRKTEWQNFWDKHPRFSSELKEAAIRCGYTPESCDAFIRQIRIDSVYTPDSLLRHTLADHFVIEGPDTNMILTLLYPSTPNDRLDTSLLSKIPNTFLFNRASMNKSLIETLSEDFNFVLWICGFLVFFFLLLSFGRIELALIGILPMAISWIWILGLMGLFNISFNIVNIVLATFIFGLGDDYSIFMIEGIVNAHARRQKLLSSYRVAVLLSALTMFIGIGSLIIAKHPAMRSLAQVTMIGMLAVVWISYSLIPLLFDYLLHKNGKLRPVPLTLGKWIKTAYAFSCFILGCSILSLLSIILRFPIGSKDKRKMILHRVLCAMSRFVVRVMPQVKTLSCIPPDAFSIPSILVANHQSHLDLVYILQLSPKIIVLTNQWVWRSPFYGFFIRFADFYPVMKGLESSVHHLRPLVAKGYSILIFPEGSRSQEGEMRRFHQGAFYLSEQLQIPIQALVMHGLGHVLPKSQLCLNKGRINIKMLPPFPIAKLDENGSFLKIAKQMRRCMQTQYAELVRQEENVDYWRNYTKERYLYKGTDIERSVGRTLRHEASTLDDLPREGSIRINEKGYGETAFLAALIRPKAKITAYCTSEDGYQVASALSCIPSNLQFIQSKESDETN